MSRLAIADPPYPPMFSVRNDLAAGGERLTEPVPATGFVGAKPARWTRWVLDALGYDPAEDTVADLFPGSGAVTNEARQLVLSLTEGEIDEVVQR